MSDKPESHIDWSLTSWNGARKETLRRWSKLPLEQIIAALEEMEALNSLLRSTSDVNRVAESGAGYETIDTERKTDKEKK
jgi:hypothetical protein